MAPHILLKGALAEPLNAIDSRGRTDSEFMPLAYVEDGADPMARTREL